MERNPAFKTSPIRKLPFNDTSKSELRLKELKHKSNFHENVFGIRVMKLLNFLSIEKYI